MAEIEGQISWVYCDDLDAVCRFYSKTLGLDLWRDAGTARIYRSVGAAMIGICRAFEGRQVQPAGGMITLLSEDVDGWYDRLKAHDVKLHGPPREQREFGIYSFFCEDPNGYVIEIQKFL